MFMKVKAGDRNTPTTVTVVNHTGPFTATQHVVEVNPGEEKLFEAPATLHVTGDKGGINPQFRQRHASRKGYGVVTKFDPHRGFGFIANANTDERFFFHITSVKELDDIGYPYKPKMGDIFVFEIVRDAKGGFAAVGLERIVDGKRRSWN